MAEIVASMGSTAVNNLLSQKNMDRAFYIAAGTGVVIAVSIGGYIYYKKQQAQKAGEKVSSSMQNLTANFNSLQSEQQVQAVTIAAVQSNLTSSVQIAEQSLDAIIAQDWAKAYELIVELTTKLYTALIDNQTALKSNYSQQISAYQAKLAALQGSSRRTSWAVVAVVPLGQKGDIFAKYPGNGRTVMTLWPESLYKEQRSFETEYLAAAKAVNNEVPKCNEKIAACDKEIARLSQARIDFQQRRGSVYNNAESKFSAVRRAGNYDTAVNSTKNVVASQVR